MIRTLLLYITCTVTLLCASTGAQAWWNEDWSQRTVVTIDTSAKGLVLAEAVNDTLIAVRLHSGNFDFAAAQVDGSDLRVIAADDKTPLPYAVERFDGVNELALIWVRVPAVAAGSDQNKFYVYGGNAKPPAAQAATPAVQSAPLIFNAQFSEPDGPAVDAVGQIASRAAAQRDPNGLLAGSLRLGPEPLLWEPPQAPRAAVGALSISLWVKPERIDAGTLLRWGALQLKMEQGALVAEWPGQTVRGGTLATGAWTHVALVSGAGQTRLYVAGKQAATTAAALPAIEGPLAIGGADANGLLDALQISTNERSASAILLAAASQGAEAAFVKSQRESSGEDGGASHGYMGILVSNLTLDAWVVIGILAAMFVVAAWVMATKTLDVVRIDRGNQDFLQRFRSEGERAFAAEAIAATGANHATHSSLERLHRTGLAELRKREAGQNGTALSGASFNAVKAVLDADLVRESHTLNAKMVLLTIAISGGPFLGLLGTVVGVMITFAAIAAAGDVNVNAIAPGIAAALLATVAGLGVAIPALFGYNWLASRIKNISADMQIFVDEFITRAAETHGQG